MNIKNWKCDCCKKDITNYDELENEVYAETHFDIERSIKDFCIEDDVVIERNLDRNVKMKRALCEDCFNKILQESPTLKKLFEYRIDNEIKILY